MHGDAWRVPEGPHLYCTPALVPYRRAGEAASTGLTEDLVRLGFETDRLKTGTPARVDKRTVDYSALEAQPGDEDVRWFSFDPSVHVPRPQLTCYLTRTTAETHKLIRENLKVRARDCVCVTVCVWYTRAACTPAGLAPALPCTSTSAAAPVCTCWLRRCLPWR